MTPSLLAALAAVAALSGEPQTEPRTQPTAEPPPAAVELRFRWPAGLAGTVVSTRTRTRLPAEPSPRTLTSRYAWRAEPAGERIRIRISDATFESSDLGALPPAAAAQLAQLTDLSPDYLVGAAGEFVTIEDLPRFQAAIRSFLGPLVPAEGMPPGLDAFARALASESFLNGKAREQWDIIVGFWAGAELEPGAEYTLESRQPVPLVPGQEIRMNTRFSLARMVPCARSGVPRRCAELELRSSVDPEDAERMIRELLAAIAGKETPGLPPFRSFEMATTISVTTEPDGLIPHACKIRKEVRASIEDKGQPIAVEQVDLAEILYSYPAPGP